MLRGSSQVGGTEADLLAIVRGADVDSQVPHGTELLQFVDAVLGKGADPEQARNALAACAGLEAVADAAGVIGNFMRMVRIADGTGIPIDSYFDEPGREIRDRLGIDSFSSARTRQ
jgi:hypothetical protein